MILSTSNRRVKDAAALTRKPRERKEREAFVVEGPRMFEEIPESQLLETFVAEGYLARNPEEAGRLLAGKAYETVSDEVMRWMSDTQNPQGILAVVRQNSWRMEDLLAGAGTPLLMILESLQDPGNLGTILRAGEGAGITGVLVNQDTADLYNPKVVRSTMGSVFRVPFVRTDNLPEAVMSLRSSGVRVYAAHLMGKCCYEEEDYTEPSAFMIGNEAAGLTEALSSLADSRVKIPMLGRVESLNAAVAASVLMYEAARQRRSKKEG